MASDSSDNVVESTLNFAKDIQVYFNASNQVDTADFIIICNDERFPVHKTILSARSDVLAAMLRQKDMEEGSTSEMKIDDVDPTTLRSFLK